VIHISERLCPSQKNLNDLRSNNNKLNRETALSEKDETINARGDKPNMHDILTGSQLDGRAFSGSEDMTCRNWTSSTISAAMLGHHDHQGLRDDEFFEIVEFIPFIPRHR
jgi:hypothetical protein